VGLHGGYQLSCSAYAEGFYGRLLILRRKTEMNAHFYIRLALGCLVIVGIWTLFEKDMLLDKVGDYLVKQLPKWVTFPLFECPICMSSVHGTWIWFITNGEWTGWPIFCIALCGAMKIIAHNLLR